MVYTTLDKNPLVSIITLNYNQADTTCQFLLSTKCLTYKNFEILVCDMNSVEDPSSKISRLQIPPVFYLASITLGLLEGTIGECGKQKEPTYLL